MLTTSLVIGVVTTALTWAARIITLKLQYNKELREAELVALNSRAKVTREAREYDNKGFQITRRIIALTTTLCVMAIPFLLPLWYLYQYPIDILNDPSFQPSVWFGYNIIDKGFWPFTSDTTTTVWKEFRGIVITPWHTDTFSWIMGMYFGNRLGKPNM